VAPFSPGQRVDELDDGDVGAKVVAQEAGLVPAEVVLVELVDRTHRAGEEAPAQGAVRDEPDPELANRRQNLCFGIA
jgi:hypothetical protein